MKYIPPLRINKQEEYAVLRVFWAVPYVFWAVPRVFRVVPDCSVCVPGGSVRVPGCSVVFRRSVLLFRVLVHARFTNVFSRLPPPPSSGNFPPNDVSSYFAAECHKGTVE